MKKLLGWIFWLIWPVDAGGMFYLALICNSPFFSVAFALTGTLSVLIAQRTSPEAISHLFD